MKILGYVLMFILLFSTAGVGLTIANRHRSTGYAPAVSGMNGNSFSIDNEVAEDIRREVRYKKDLKGLLTHWKLKESIDRMENDFARKIARRKVPVSTEKESVLSEELKDYISEEKEILEGSENKPSKEKRSLNMPAELEKEIFLNDALEERVAEIKEELKKISSKKRRDLGMATESENTAEMRLNEERIKEEEERMFDLAQKNLDFYYIYFIRGPELRPLLPKLVMKESTDIRISYLSKVTIHDSGDIRLLPAAELVIYNNTFNLEEIERKVANFKVFPSKNQCAILNTFKEAISALYSVVHDNIMDELAGLKFLELKDSLTYEKVENLKEAVFDKTCRYKTVNLCESIYQEDRSFISTPWNEPIMRLAIKLDVSVKVQEKYLEKIIKTAKDILAADERENEMALVIAAVQADYRPWEDFGCKTTQEAFRSFINYADASRRYLSGLHKTLSDAICFGVKSYNMRIFGVGVVNMNDFILKNGFFIARMAEKLKLTEEEN